MRSRRAQTSLVAVAVALLTLTVVTGLSLAAADGALASADRDPRERRAAASLAARLVAPDSPLTVRENVLSATAVERFDGAQLEAAFPTARDIAVTVRVNHSVVASTGETSDGTAMRRLVVVNRPTERTLVPSFGPRRRVTLPRRDDAATIRVDPPSGSTVTTVRADGRVVLHDPGGLAGTFDVRLSRYETTTLQFVGSGPLPSGSVEIRYAPPDTTKATLVVTVDG